MTANLQAINPHTGEIAGCYSPCSLLIHSNWNNLVSEGRKTEDPEVAPYCCPTPPETPDACREGPITKTEFVQVVHRSCPGVYGYAYDDAKGLLRCNSNSQYKVTFYCPKPMLHVHKLPHSYWWMSVVAFIFASIAASGALAMLWQRGRRLDYEQIPGRDSPFDTESLQSLQSRFEDLQGQLRNHASSIQDSVRNGA